MATTEKDLAVLKALAAFRFLVRPQIQELCFPDHKGGRGTRKHVSKLLADGLIHRTKAQVAFGNALGCPVHWLSAAGAEFLAARLDDPSYLACTTRPPRTDRLDHWIAIAQSHLLLHQAAERSREVELTAWVNEWDLVRNENGQPQQFYLHTVLRENPPLSASPDAAFVLTVESQSLVVYVEEDRGDNYGGTGARQFAAKKTPGYMELAARSHHRVHFPQATLDTFRVLVIAPTIGRRNRLAEAVEAKDNRPDLWRFVSKTDLTPETFLHAPIIYDTKGVPRPLVKPRGVNDTGSDGGIVTPVPTLST